MSPTRIDVETDRPYPVFVGKDVWQELGAYLPAGTPAALLTDRTVAALHKERVSELAALPDMEVEPGEGAKSFSVLEEVLDFLADAGLDRDSRLVAFGGGAVGDLGGLAASLFMRGIDVLQAPTTLLAQVDSSVGGKTAVNLKAGKNLAGTFHQPLAVFADVQTLTTLPEEEFASGLGEVVKSAVIGDADLLTLLERNVERIQRRELELMAEIVTRCVRLKASVVAADEKESGERKKLNLGHTFAHGIEAAAGYGTIPHGIAVGVGLHLALKLGASLGIAKDPELDERVRILLLELGLCADLASLRERYDRALSAADLLEGMAHDKKGRASEPALVLVEAVGSIQVDRSVGREELERILA